jgi:hypothetical protein
MLVIFIFKKNKKTTTNQVCPNGVIIIKKYTIILESALKHIVILNTSQMHISAEVKPTIIIPFYKKGNRACVQNYRRTRVTLVNKLLIVLEYLWYYLMVN